ncbi:hypothetical protein M426DRAFT_319244 [Hypoxylon sp. CI-4A]|nr:hypothetical protein M426DRAFT_319244 [Hypoxylon sp. CI-4A]
MSNPNPESPPRSSNGRRKGNVSITPRKFKKFFTPRSRVPEGVSPARKALKDLAVPNVTNRYQTPAPSSPIGPSSGRHARDENLDPTDIPRPKRRKYHHTPESSPCRPRLTSDMNFGLASSPNPRPGLLSPIRSLRSFRDIESDDDEDEGDEDSDVELPTRSGPIRRLAPLTTRGFAGRLAQRQLGGMPRAGRSFMSCPTEDWRIDTADFVSTPPDVHICSSHEHPGECMPFSLAPCHTNSLTAVGDEEGRIRLLDTSNHSFHKTHISFQAHSNAIIDLAFSDDDYRLATASGDQTGRVIDMMTQTPIAILEHHTASLKQVRFQPGAANGSVLATSSRDGSVQVWDLRCAGALVQDALVDYDDPSVARRSLPKLGAAVNSLYHAHACTSRQAQQGATAGQDRPSRRELPSRIGDVSVTALQFLPPGQEHLLLTTCEADASIKLWDIRSIYSSNKKVPTPLSVVAPPSSHQQWRPFGITSLALSTDTSRLYALCKDNTVYAYSTAHLILGHAPELSTRNGGPPRRRHNATAHDGLGPLYGFRHPMFHASSFYVKCAVRPARDGRSELLAVGSSDKCAVLFPTQERHFKDDLSSAMSSLTLENSTIATTQRPSSSATVMSASSNLFRMGMGGPPRLNDDIPIIQKGTPLIRGHAQELGAIAWTNDGKLVAVDDESLIRCWSEDRETASWLRASEEGGRRWGMGWADVGDAWDVPDDDES